MDLTERITRLIDPDEWATADYYLAHELPESAAYLTEESMRYARRVIDGLHLRTELISRAAGHTIAYRITGTIQEDA